MKAIFRQIFLFLSERFNLNEDKEDEPTIIDNIRKGVEFRGTNLWTLIFAIFIASIGLNVNSTAVIIGAMLISPLMGPIMGVGLGIGINDFPLVQRGLKNLLIATFISVLTSAIYFWITPLHDAQSELLARTSPTLWDVFIAFIGGLAGIVAGTRKAKTNVIPGVAIATALMPPLCTAGYGIASGNYYYFLGAIYLYFINSLFICISTFLIVKYLRFKKVNFDNPERERKITRYILILVVLTVIPSIFLAYRIVAKSIFENNARQYVQDEFKFERTQVVLRNFKFSTTAQKEIDLLLIGDQISQNKIDSLKLSLTKYNLKGTHLVIRQGLDAKKEVDVSQIRASILEDVYSRRDSLSKQVSMLEKDTLLKSEFSALFPELRYFSISDAFINNVSNSKTDTVKLVLASFSKEITAKERVRLRDWLQKKTQADSLKLVIE